MPDFELHMNALARLWQLREHDQLVLYLKSDYWTKECCLHSINDLQLDFTAPDSVVDNILATRRHSSVPLLASTLFESAGLVRRGSLPD